MATLKEYFQHALDHFVTPQPPIVKGYNSAFRVEVRQHPAKDFSLISDLTFSPQLECLGDYYEIKVIHEPTQEPVGRCYLAYRATPELPENMHVKIYPTVYSTKMGVSPLLLVPRNFNAQELCVEEHSIDHPQALEAVNYQCDINYMIYLISRGNAQNQAFFKESIGSRTHFYKGSHLKLVVNNR